MPEDMQKFYDQARQFDPLFGRSDRDFQPTIHDLIKMIDIDGKSYNPPGNGNRERINFSLRPDLVADIQTFAARYDMTASATVDGLLRVALGDYAEWWNTYGADEEAK